MKIDFDEAKDAANRLKHGMSLSRAADFIAVAVIEDDRFDYGEPRFRAFGHVEGIACCLAYTVRGETVRPISLRRAHAKEMKRYVP